MTLDAALTWQAVSKAMKAPGEFGQDVGWQLGQEWEKNFGKGQPKEADYLAERQKEFKPVGDLMNMALDRYVAKRDSFDASSAPQDPKWREELDAEREGLWKAYREFGKRRDELIVTQYRAKWNPSRENFDKVQTQILPEMEVARLKAVQSLLAEVKKSGVEVDGRLKLNGIPVEAARPEMAGPASKWRAGLDKLDLRLGEMFEEFAAGRGKSNEQIAAGEAKNAMSALAGAAFGAANGLQAVKKAGVQIDEYGGLRAKMVDLIPVTERKSDQFQFEWDQLAQMRDLNRKGEKGFERFGDREFNLASADLFKRFAPQAGREQRLPTAAEYGSQQAAEMYARANSAGGATTANLLQQLIAAEQQQLAEAKRQTEAFERNQPKVIMLAPL